MDDWLTIALALGLAARLTRLITLDTITQPVRDRLKGFLAALIECPWCSGVWVAVPVGLSWLWWADQTWWQVTALIGTIAWVAGALAGVGMPRQVEVATVSPVALVNADDAPADTINIHTELDEADVDQLTDQIVEAIERRRKNLPGEAVTASDDGADGSY